jgi:hypothetical protein
VRRLSIATRASLGAALLLWPARLLATIAGRSTSRPERAAARVLGARHLSEALVLCRDPDRGPALVVAGVDTVHALTMAALAAARPRERRLATLSAAAGLLLAATASCQGGWLPDNVRRPLTAPR